MSVYTAVFKEVGRGLKMKIELRKLPINDGIDIFDMIKEIGPGKTN